MRPKNERRENPAVGEASAAEVVAASAEVVAAAVDEMAGAAVEETGAEAAGHAAGELLTSSGANE